MDDYKQMYIELFKSTEKAINILIKAQQDAEENYIKYIKDEVKPNKTINNEEMEHEFNKLLGKYK